MSPMVSGQVGSPTRQTSMRSPFSAIKSSNAVVPSRASPSSSPVIASTMEPSGGVSFTKSTAAATKAATPDFISVVPRPYMMPSLISAPKGGIDQSASSPMGTTSVWPLKPKDLVLPLLPQRAKRLQMPPRSTRVQSNPAASSTSSSTSNAPSLTGVTEAQRTSFAVRSTGSRPDISAPFQGLSLVR